MGVRRRWRCEVGLGLELAARLGVDGALARAVAVAVGAAAAVEHSAPHPAAAARRRRREREAGVVTAAERRGRQRQSDGRRRRRRVDGVGGVGRRLHARRLPAEGAAPGGARRVVVFEGKSFSLPWKSPLDSFMS